MFKYHNTRAQYIVNTVSHACMEYSTKYLCNTKRNTYTIRYCARMSRCLHNTYTIHYLDTPRIQYCVRM